jgi:SynChlorMet cassette protein ScmC
MERTVSCLLPGGTEYGLSLADGSFWAISAADAAAVPVVSRLAEVMRLRVMGLTISPPPGVVRRLLVTVENQNPEPSQLAPFAPLPSEGSGIVHCVLPPPRQDVSLYMHAMRLSVVVAREAQTRGGVLLHGALAERDGMGVIMAAPGGRGKTTASDRLSPPWRSFCDDTTLVVPEPQGNYRAHPWPTWSRFLVGGSNDGSWDVQHSVPLGGIFFLSQAAEDRVEPVGAGQGVSLLVECAKQGSMVMARGLGREATRALNLERFNNLCAVARVVPAHLLHISLTGAYWLEIERAMKMQSARH